jgi:hypothetical protein
MRLQNFYKKKLNSRFCTSLKIYDKEENLNSICSKTKIETDYFSQKNMPLPFNVRADWLGYWDKFVQIARFKKLVCLCHIKQNDLTYLGRVCTPCL